MRYLSFDDANMAELARRNPKEILNPPCAIDEAQKVPGIFDAVKFDVDQNKRPGKYILTGSVRFSKRTLIRESLTGRARTLQMFPLTCAESLQLPFEDRWSHAKVPRIKRSELNRFLVHGGMPAIFSARRNEEVRTYWNSLIDSYVYRDLLLAIPKNAKPNIALSILTSIATILSLGELPTFARLFKKVGGTRASFERHLQGLEDLMIIHRISCFEASPIKDIFMPFDSAFFLTLLKVESPHHDFAIHMACLYIQLINEVLAQAQNHDHEPKFMYAESPSGEIVHFVTKGKKNQMIFWKISEEAIPHTYALRYICALAKKHNGIARVLSSTEKAFKINHVQYLPWETIL